MFNLFVKPIFVNIPKIYTSVTNFYLTYPWLLGKKYTRSNQKEMTQMGRARKQKARDKNKQSLPQTPRKDIATTDDDLQWAKEIDGKYDERD